MALGHEEPATLAAWSPTVGAGHVRGGRRLVDEDDGIGVEVELTLEPRLPCGSHVRTLLLGRVDSPF